MVMGGLSHVVPSAGVRSVNPLSWQSIDPRIFDILSNVIQINAKSTSKQYSSHFQHTLPCQSSPTRP
jgi:hypothetical protein